MFSSRGPPPKTSHAKGHRPIPMKKRGMICSYWKGPWDTGSFPRAAKEFRSAQKGAGVKLPSLKIQNEMRGAIETTPPLYVPKANLRRGKCFLKEIRREDKFRKLSRMQHQRIKKPKISKKSIIRKLFTKQNHKTQYGLLPGQSKEKWAQNGHFPGVPLEFFEGKNPGSGRIPLSSTPVYGGGSGATPASSSSSHCFFRVLVLTWWVSLPKSHETSHTGTAK